MRPHTSAPVSQSSRLRRLAATTVIAVAALAGCQSGNESSGGDYSAPGSSSSDTAVSEGSAADAEAAPAESTAVDSDTVIVTGSATVRVDDPQASLAEIARDVADAGGSVQNSSLSVRGDDPYAELVVRIPAESYQQFVDELPTYGEVLSTQTSTEEVGEQLADVKARIAALETSIARLSEMLTQTESVTELLEVEGMLTSRQAELDGLNAQLTWLEDQVAMSTLTIDLTTHADGSRATSGPSTLERAWRYFTESLQGILYFLAVALPWLVVGGVLAALLVPVLRRRRERAAETSGSSRESVMRHRRVAAMDEPQDAGAPMPEPQDVDAEVSTGEDLDADAPAVEERDEPEGRPTS